jgi:hypothetical protein
MVTRLRAGRPGFDSRQRLLVGSTLSPVHWVPGRLTPGLRRPGREAHHSFLVTRLRMRGAIPLLPICPYDITIPVHNDYFLL